MNQSDKEILTAYFDHELPGWKRKKVLALLKSSPTARYLFRRLLRDQRGLRKLVVAEPSAALVSHAMARIKARPYALGRDLFSSSKEALLNPLFALSMAAGILAITCGVSIYIFSSLKFQQENPVQAKVLTEKELAKEANVPKEVALKQPVENNQLSSLKKSDQPDKATNLVDKNQPVPVVEKKSVPGKAKEDPLLTAPTKEKFTLEKVEAIIPLVLKTASGNEKDFKTSVFTYAGKEKAIRLEIPVKDSLKAIAQIKGTLESIKYQLIGDSVSNRRLKSQPIKPNHLLLIEDISPTDLCHLLLPIPKVTAKATNDITPLWDTVVMSRITLNDHKQIKGYLGSNLDQISASSSEKERLGFGEQKGNSTGAQKGNKIAIGIPYPFPFPLNSLEIKKFLDARSPIKEGNLQVLILIRADL